MGLRGIPKKNDALVDKYVYRPISTRISGLLLRTSITPNQLTVLSIFCAMTAGWFLTGKGYTSLVIGGILISLTNIFDACGGEVARAKNIKSDFGAWLDGIADRISFFFIFLGASLGSYLRAGDPWILVVGYVAGSSIMIAGMITSTKKYLPFMQDYHEGQRKSGVYIGLGGTTFFLMSLAAIFNVIEYGLWLFAILGVLMVLKQILSHYRRAIAYQSRPKG